MDSLYVYNRVLIKLSGEALKGDAESGYDSDAINVIVNRIGSVADKGIELAIVIGGGNIWRGVRGVNTGMDRVTADYMGMLGTVMNAICLRDAFNAAGFIAEVQSSISMLPIAPLFNREKAVKSLNEGKIMIFAGGTGSPFFTTDTTATLRALEIGAEAVLKATKVDGIYTEDPKKNPNAKRYEKISYDDALSQQLKVMDSTAFSMCRDNNLPIIVFNFSEPESLERVLQGDTSIATVVGNPE
ncbi:MAG TPA: UMP kinase [Lentisphaeria bacterium]|nr:UMP kinase [Lentisphaeria bacterium]